MVLDQDSCRCSCHRDGSIHFIACCGVCQGCDRDRVANLIDYGLCVPCTKVRDLPDQGLRDLADGDDLRMAYSAVHELRRRQVR